jgi:hypothetical protein
VHVPQELPQLSLPHCLLSQPQVMQAPLLQTWSAMQHVVPHCCSGPVQIASHVALTQVCPAAQHVGPQMRAVGQLHIPLTHVSPPLQHAAPHGRSHEPPSWAELLPASRASGGQPGACTGEKQAVLSSAATTIGRSRSMAPPQEGP